MIVLFVVFSFMIGALFTFHFYRKFIISKKNILKNQTKPHDIYNGYESNIRGSIVESYEKTKISKILSKICLKKKENKRNERATNEKTNEKNQQISCVSVVSSICSNSQQPSPFLVSSSVCSSQSFETNTKGSLYKTNLNDYESRFVYSNNNEITQKKNSIPLESPGQINLEKTIIEKANFLDYDDCEYFTLKKKLNQQTKQTRSSSSSSPNSSHNSNSLASLIKNPLNSNHQNVNIYTLARPVLAYKQSNASSSSNTINRYYV